MAFPTIDEIVPQLTADLHKRGFSEAAALEGEVVRYAKKESPVGFQVGVHEFQFEPSEPTYARAYFCVGHALPSGVAFESRCSVELFLPTNGTLPYIFSFEKGVSAIFYGPEPDGEDRVSRGCSLMLEKSKIDAQKLRSLLREVIDYFAKYADLQFETMNRTQQ